MKKYIWISLLFLFSCGSRKANKSVEKLTEQTTEQSVTESETKTTTETSKQTLFNLFENNMNFAIKPISDLPAKFVFIHNGQKIEGETSGELNFSNQQKTVNKKTEITQKLVTTYQTKTTYKTNTTYKSVTKHKATESKRSEFAWYLLSFLSGIAFVISIQLLWVTYGRGVIDRFKNGKIKL